MGNSVPHFHRGTHFACNYSGSIVRPNRCQNVDDITCRIHWDGIYSIYHHSWTNTRFVRQVSLVYIGNPNHTGIGLDGDTSMLFVCKCECNVVDSHWNVCLRRTTNNLCANRARRLFFGKPSAQTRSAYRMVARATHIFRRFVANATLFHTLIQAQILIHTDATNHFSKN